MRGAKRKGDTIRREELDPDAVPADVREGSDLRSIGPSDSSDSGSDLMGSGDLGAEEGSDRNGTGEYLTAGKEPDVRIAADIAPDRIVGPEEAGLGTGLDEAEEALLEDSLRRRR
jgi:hypothetical protein